MEIVYILSSDLSRREKRPYGGGCVELLLVDDALYLLQGQISCDGDDGKFIFFLTHQYKFLFFVFVPFQINDGLFAFIVYAHQFLVAVLGTDEGSPDKPGGLSIQLCKSEKKEFYIRYSS